MKTLTWLRNLKRLKGKQMSKDPSVIEAAVIKLIMSERFFAELIMNMRYHIDPKMPHVAGINVTDTINLFINPNMWATLTLKEQVAVLKHECSHVIYNHFARWKDLNPEAPDAWSHDKEDKDIVQQIMDSMERTAGNYAGDFAINEYLPDLPKTIKILDKEGKETYYPNEMKDEQGNMIPHPKAGEICTGALLFVDDWREQDPTIEKFQHMEYYYERLKEDGKKNGGQIQIVVGDGIGSNQTIDDHSLWDKGASNPEYITEKVKQAVNKAADAAKGAGHSIPPRTQELIDRLNYKPRDWRGDLQKFAAKALNVVKESSRKVRNRRYGVLYPGYKALPLLHLGLLIDSSGSMYDELLQQVLVECEKILTLGVNITVIVCDDKVHAVEAFEVGKKFDLAGLAGRGGTAFQPAFEEAAKLDLDGAIYFTDGDNFDKKEVRKPKFPVMWALPERCDVTYDWGSKTKITINKK